LGRPFSNAPKLFGCVDAEASFALFGFAIAVSEPEPATVSTRDFIDRRPVLCWEHLAWTVNLVFNCGHSIAIPDPA
jgi:hypothetical protein